MTAGASPGYGTNVRSTWPHAEHFESDVRNASGNTCHRQRARLGTSRIEKIGQRAVGRRAVYGNDHRRARELADWLEARQRVVIAPPQMRADNECRRGNQQRVAIGRGVGHGFGSDDCTCAGPVLNHDGYALGAADLLTQDAGEGVGGTARCQWNDNLDCP